MKDEMDKNRRAALAKLASLTAYTTPAVLTLLTPTLSHAQTSATVNAYNEGNLTARQTRQYERCIDPNRRRANLQGGLGNNLAGNAGDDLSDCNKQ